VIKCYIRLSKIVNCDPMSGKALSKIKDIIKLPF
jgi:hypothetical protein